MAVDPQKKKLEETPTLPPFPPFLLEVGPLNPPMESGERCKLPSSVWGRAPAEIEFGAFLPSNLISGGNNFNNFHVNLLTKFNENCFYRPMNTVCISTKMSTPEKVGGKTQGVPSTSKSRGTCPPVHPQIYVRPC